MTRKTRLSPTATTADAAKVGLQKYRRPIPPRSIFAPLAPLATATMASPPTVAISTTNPQAAGRNFPFFSTTTNMVNTKWFGLARGANWLQTSAGASSGWATQTSPESFTSAPASVILGFDGDAITFMVKSNSAHLYRFRIDGQFVAFAPVAGPGGATTQYITLTFADARPRRIEFEQTNGFFYGVYVDTNDTPPWGLNPRGPRVAVVADSYCAGDDAATVGYSAFTSGVGQMADALGWDDMINGGIAGTGWITRFSARLNNGQDRAADVVTWNPDIVVFALGHNDLALSSAAITAAVTATLNTIRAGLPDAAIIVFGPFFAGAPVDGSREATWGVTEDAIFAGVLPSHRAITIATTTVGIFTGTGKSGTPGTGNGEMYLQNEATATHPLQLGATYLGYRMTQLMIAAVSGL